MMLCTCIYMYTPLLIGLACNVFFVSMSKPYPMGFILCVYVFVSVSPYCVYRCDLFLLLVHIRSFCINNVDYLKIWEQ